MVAGAERSAEVPSTSRLVDTKSLVKLDHYHGLMAWRDRRSAWVAPPTGRRERAGNTADSANGEEPQNDSADGEEPQNASTDGEELRGPTSQNIEELKQILDVKKARML